MSATRKLLARVIEKGELTLDDVITELGGSSVRRFKTKTKLAKKLMS